LALTLTSQAIYGTDSARIPAYRSRFACAGARCSSCRAPADAHGRRIPANPARHLAGSPDRLRRSRTVGALAERELPTRKSLPSPNTWPGACPHGYRDTNGPTRQQGCRPRPSGGSPRPPRVSTMLNGAAAVNDSRYPDRHVWGPQPRRAASRSGRRCRCDPPQHSRGCGCLAGKTPGSGISLTSRVYMGLSGAGA
jgi:hypothetical protein